jgi:hypothetical protein
MRDRHVTYLLFSSVHLTDNKKYQLSVRYKNYILDVTRERKARSPTALHIKIQQKCKYCDVWAIF